MPTNRRYRRRRRIEEPPPEPPRTNRGYEFLGDPYEDFWHAEMNLDEIREVWEAVREEFLAYWTIEHPGTRPWYWWMFVATEPRFIGSKYTNGEMLPMTKAQMAGRCDYNGEEMHPFYAEQLGMIIETQTDYLDRCGLLTDQERETLGR